jgi:hypothetical protein
MNFKSLKQNFLKDMTGLSMETAEQFQVQNYGVGGHYNPHWDHRFVNYSSFELTSYCHFNSYLFHQYFTSSMYINL